MSKVGIENGKTIIALKMALFPRDRAAPKAPNKLMNKVPNKRLIIKAIRAPEGRYRKIELIIEAKIIGAPQTNQ